MSRVLEMTAEARAVSFTIRTFRSYEDAERWLRTGADAAAGLGGE
jgi:hypothetical protein